MIETELVGAPNVHLDIQNLLGLATEADLLVRLHAFRTSEAWRDALGRAFFVGDLNPSEVFDGLHRHQTSTATVCARWVELAISAIPLDWDMSNMDASARRSFLRWALAWDTCSDWNVEVSPLGRYLQHQPWAWDIVIGRSANIVVLDYDRRLDELIGWHSPGPYLLSAVCLLLDGVLDKSKNEVLKKSNRETLNTIGQAYPDWLALVQHHHVLYGSLMGDHQRETDWKRYHDARLPWMLSAMAMAEEAKQGLEIPLNLFSSLDLERVDVA